MKKINLLGASGSIGMQTVDVCLQHPDLFQIVSFSVGRNIEQCHKILSMLPPVKLVCTALKEDALKLQAQYPDIHFTYGDEGLNEVATWHEGDTLVNALVGFVGLMPTMEAIKAKKEIALANKETLVVAGEIVTKACKENHVRLVPIDSEHSAIFQALQGNDHADIERLIITASGGSFRHLKHDELANVTLDEALNHPNWKMGAKITIDSATMMNKGFEVIEAHWLFDIDYDHIDVLLHPESVIHSMIEYQDHAIMAQLGTPDMRLPIQYALSYPKRLPLNDERLDFIRLKQLNFKEVDMERYPLLALAYKAGKMKGNLAAVMNGANDMANQLFREGKISFLQIEELVIDVCNACEFKKDITLEDCIEANAWGKQAVLERLR